MARRGTEFDQYAILAKLRNDRGPLTDDVRTRLIWALTQPGPATWNDAYSVVVATRPGPSLTLWQAVRALDPTFPDKLEVAGQWPRVPTVGEIRGALAYAALLMTVARQEQFLKQAADHARALASD